MLEQFKALLVEQPEKKSKSLSPHEDTGEKSRQLAGSNRSNVSLLS